VKESIIEALKPFAGTKFDVGHEHVDREVWDFLWHLEPVISQAGWIHIDWAGLHVFGKSGWPGNHLYGVANVNNVSLEVTPPMREALGPALQALAGALRSIGIETATEDFNNASTNNDAIHLLVGPKR
jgi:hypothetical protein